MADTENTLILETTQGPVTIEMRPDLAPGVVRDEAGALLALLDGLALQLIRQGPDDPCDWALDVLQDHLEQLTGAAAGFRDMRDPGH